MIVSFGDRATEDLYHGQPTNRACRFPNDIVSLALVKLDMLNGASAVLDLKSPPGNRLEALKGDLKGLHSIRVNDQWRVVFRWENNSAHDVRLMDYHKWEARP
ncbi:MAG: type II toxin-antitoxin system RelE/ParE family toxin [Coriobacteriia bacterium]|nr:type II toxin-antitoxin system RelE/ParE family toxin [Coriobacteriia bacterium]